MIIAGIFLIAFALAVVNELCQNYNIKGPF
jgi:hypothetical protein